MLLPEELSALLAASALSTAATQRKPYDLILILLFRRDSAGL